MTSEAPITQESMTEFMQKWLDGILHSPWDKQGMTVSADWFEITEEGCRGIFKVSSPLHWLLEVRVMRETRSVEIVRWSEAYNKEFEVKL